MTTQELAAAMALVVKDYMRTDRAALETRLAVAEARLAELTTVPARLVAVEMKAAQPVTAAVDVPPPVDLSPVLERLAASEARLNVLGDLRDRVVTIETKATQIPTPDLGDVPARLTTLESDLRVAKEMHWSNHSAPAEKVDLAPVLEKCEALGTEVNALRERVAIAETRQFIPGPMGRDGQPGRDGKDGTNGTDGLGWDDLNVQQIDERTFAVKCLRGLQVKELGTLTFPVEIYRGVYVEGKSYDRGDGVTWGGSEWHCNQTTTSKPGDGSKDWTLKVKRGRDGKDGRDANPLPVVSVGKR